MARNDRLRLERGFDRQQKQIAEDAASVREQLVSQQQALQQEEQRLQQARQQLSQQRVSNIQQLSQQQQSLSQLQGRQQQLQSQISQLQPLRQRISEQESLAQQQLQAQREQILRDFELRQDQRFTPAGQDLQISNIQQQLKQSFDSDVRDSIRQQLATGQNTIRVTSTQQPTINFTPLSTNQAVQGPVRPPQVTARKKDFDIDVVGVVAKPLSKVVGFIDERIVRPTQLKLQQKGVPTLESREDLIGRAVGATSLFLTQPVSSREVAKDIIFLPAFTTGKFTQSSAEIAELALKEQIRNPKIQFVSVTDDNVIGTAFAGDVAGKRFTGFTQSDIIRSETGDVLGSQGKQLFFKPQQGFTQEAVLSDVATVKTSSGGVTKVRRIQVGDKFIELPTPAPQAKSFSQLTFEQPRQTITFSTKNINVPGGASVRQGQVLDTVSGGDLVKGRVSGLSVKQSEGVTSVLAGGTRLKVGRGQAVQVFDPDIRGVVLNVGPRNAGSAARTKFVQSTAPASVTQTIRTSAKQLFQPQLTSLANVQTKQSLQNIGVASSRELFFKPSVARTIPKSKTKDLITTPAITQAEAQATRNVARQILSLENKQREREIATQGFTTVQTQTQGERLATITGVLTKQLAKQSQITRQTGTTTPKTPTRPRIPTPTTPKIPIPRNQGSASVKRFLSLLKRKFESFDVVTRRGGRPVKIGDDLPLNRALKRGSDFVAKNIAASFSLIGQKVKPKKKDIKYKLNTAMFRPPKPRSKLKGLSRFNFVERTKYRLDTPTERAQLRRSRGRSL